MASNSSRSLKSSEMKSGYFETSEDDDVEVWRKRESTPRRT